MVLIFAYFIYIFIPLLKSSKSIKKQGIISGVQLIDCIARIDKTPITVNDIFNSYNTVDDLPDGRGKTVANYVGKPTLENKI